MKSILATAVLLAAASIAQGAERVLVLPFTVLNVPESQQWIGKGVQENIVAEFGRSGEFSPVAFQGQVIVEDNATAARLARTAQSPYAVRGAAQSVGDQVRLTAQLIDAKSGDTLRTASVTGQANNLLKMEDELAAQLRGYTQPVAAPSTPAPAAPVSSAPVIIQQPAQPQIIVIQQPAAPAYSNYGYPSYPSYPYYADYGYNYGYGYPYYGGFYSFSLVSGNIGNNHDHDHGHWGGGGNGGGGRGDHGNWGGGGNGGGRGGRGGNGGGGGGGPPPLVNNFNPTALPIPNNNVLPIPLSGGGGGGGGIPSTHSGIAVPQGARAVIAPRPAGKK